METLKSMYNSGEKHWTSASGKLSSKEVGVAACCAAFIFVSYFTISSPSFHGSFLPAQNRTLSLMDVTLPLVDVQNRTLSPAMDEEDEASLQQYERTMKDVFDKAAMPNKTVIITTLNAAWAENNTMIDIFLESFRLGDGTQRLLQHLIIVCVDQKAYDRCLAVHPHCLKIKTGGVDFSGEQALLSRDYIKMIWRRIKFLSTVLEMGYSFIFTDTDILWFRDPIPQLQSDTIADIQIACDRYNGRPWDVKNKPNAGFIYVRANERTVSFYNYWYLERKRDPKMADQEVLNAIKFEDTFQSIGMKLRFLDTQFFGGFCGIKVTDMTKAYTMHATCCKGLTAKLSDLRMIFDGWKEWQQQGHDSLTRVPSAPTRHRRGQSSRAESAWVDSDSHFKVPRACQRSMRSH